MKKISLNKDLAMSQPLHYKYSSKIRKYKKPPTFFLNIIYFPLDIKKFNISKYFNNS